MSYLISYVKWVMIFSFFQAVQNRLYNDYAAIYYLLLSKWEKGQLKVPTQATPHPRLSISGVPSIIPQISIQNTDSNTSTTPPKNPFKNMASSDNPQDESEDFMKDPNLARYLQHGRRHTLGAAHNHMVLATDQLRKLREISEVSSSQTSDALEGSVGPQGSGNVAPIIISSNNLQPSLAHSSSGVNNSSQSGISAFNLPNRPYLHAPRKRMGRRSSDAAPYAAAYQLFIEKRNPLLANNGSMSMMERQDSTASRSSTSSVKMLLQEKKALGEAYGGLPTTHHKQWLQYKNQVNLMPAHVVHVMCAIHVCVCAFKQKFSLHN